MRNHNQTLQQNEMTDITPMNFRQFQGNEMMWYK